MTQIIISLVTIFHPYRYLGCESSQLQQLPHVTEYRRDRRRKVTDAGAPYEMQYMDDHVVPGNGRQLDSYLGTWVSGATILPVLRLPRLVRIPDEPQPLRKWRMECRRRWPDDSPLLSEGTLLQLRKRLSENCLRVKGVWINPTVGVDAPFSHSVNIVLGPCTADEANRLRPTTFTFVDAPEGRVEVVLNE